MLLQVIQNSHEFLFVKKSSNQKGIRLAQKNREKKVIFVLAFFYTTSFPEFSEKIRQIETEFDLPKKKNREMDVILCV